MYQNLAIFQTAHAMAQHAGARQAVTARNVANADTPDYQARHIASFSETFQSKQMGEMQVTRPGHMTSTRFGPQAEATDGTAQPSPNGNSVSIEEEMLNAVNISREHNRALAIYKHGMTILRSSLGR